MTEESMLHNWQAAISANPLPTSLFSRTGAKMARAGNQGWMQKSPLNWLSWQRQS